MTVCRRYSSGPAPYEAGGGFPGAGQGDEQGVQAFDPETGKAQWKFQLARNSQSGTEIASSPMSYAVGGPQYIAISSAGALFSFALPEGF